MYNNDRFFERRKVTGRCPGSSVSYLSKDDERPPSEAGPPPPKTQKPQKQASLWEMFRTPKEETDTQNQKDEVPLALNKRKRDADATPSSEVPNNSLLSS